MTPKEFAKKIIQSINPGTADISGIGDGTIKGAISEQNKNLQWYVEMGYLPTVFSPTAYALINTLSTFTDGDVTVSASSVYKTGCEVWRAFDGKTGGMDTDSYSPASGLKECHIDIEFAKARTVEYLYFTLCTKGNNVMEVILQSSDDGVAYDNIGTYNFTYTSTGKHKLVADNYKARKYYRLKFIATTYAIQTSGQYSGYIDDVQLYGY